MTNGTRGPAHLSRDRANREEQVGRQARPKIAPPRRQIPGGRGGSESETEGQQQSRHRRQPGALHADIQAAVRPQEGTRKGEYVVEVGVRSC